MTAGRFRLTPDAGAAFINAITKEADRAVSESALEFSKLVRAVRPPQR